MTGRSTGQQAPAFAWATSVKATDYANASRIVVDAAGNALATGWFSGTISFGGNTLVSRGGSDVYMAKYNALGQLLWLRQAGGPGNDFVDDVAVDPAGNAFITGDFSSISTSDPSNFSTMVIGSITLTGGSRRADMFLAKYDPQGNVLWARQTVGTVASFGNYGENLACDGTGSVYLCGRIMNQAQLQQLTISSTPFSDMFLAKYDSQGTLQWAKSGLGQTVSGRASFRIAVDATNAVYLLGQFTHSLTLGSTTLQSTGQLGSGLDNNPYLAKLDAQGQVLWARQEVLTTQEICDGLAIAPNGNLIVTCNFRGSTTHNGRTFISQGGPDLLTLGFTETGNFLWGMQMGGSDPMEASDQMLNPVVDTDGNIYTGALLSGMSTLTVPSGTNDMYSHLVSYSPTGALRWARTIPRYAYYVACPAPEQIVVIGVITSPTQFDGISVPSMGSSAAYVGKLVGPVVSPPVITLPAVPLTIPNIITPNGDGKNEVFRLPGLPAGFWQLDIYNRWGARVYHSDDYRQDWNAPGLPNGQYFYYLHAANKSAFKGWLEVIR